MSVTFVDFTLRAVNTGSQTCSLSGRHPVEVPWWRIVGDGPSAAEGNLPPGAALVQAYTFEGGNGCPWPGGEGDATVAVSVEGKAHLLSLPARTIHQVTVCDMVSVPAPTIQLASAGSRNRATATTSFESKQLGPGCASGGSVDLVSSGSSSINDGLPQLTARVGSPVTLNATVADDNGGQVLLAQIWVGPVDKAPNAQTIEDARTSTTVKGTQGEIRSEPVTATLTFQPSEPGTFPVLAHTRQAVSHACAESMHLTEAQAQVEGTNVIGWIRVR